MFALSIAIAGVTVSVGTVLYYIIRATRQATK
jgi:hypothetical protein